MRGAATFGQKSDQTAPFSALSAAPGTMAPRTRPSRPGVRSVVCFLCVWSGFVSGLAQEEDGGGWRSSADPRLDDGGRCNIPVMDSISYKDFIDRFAFSRPVILRGLTDNTKFRRLCSKQNLLREYGDRIVRLSTANTYSYKKVDVSFRAYVEHFLRPQTVDVLGNDTLYFFGDNNFTEWQSLFSEYSPPPFTLPHTTGAYSFGIAGAGTGVPFHWHGPGFSEVIYGRKRWFLFPPDKQPHFHPNMSSLSWVTHSYSALEEAPQECTISPGEVLYFPDRWWHATLNLDTSVFISTFLG